MLAIDTNILAYAAFAAADERKAIAIEVITAAALTEAILPMQVLIEFANASLRRRQLTIVEARRRIEEWATVFPVATTGPGDVLAALDLVKSRQLSYFDALIVATAQRAGATMLVTEDMQDGAEFGGMTILNPFVPANRLLLMQILDD